MIDSIISQARQYDAKLDEFLLRHAYEFADLVHAGQKRRSGEPHLAHVVAVTKHLVEIKIDSPTLAAGLLHDVLATPGVTEQDLIDEFDETVAELVVGVSRLKRIQTKVGGRSQSENVRNLILAAGRDVRVVLIRLAEKLHSLETMKALEEDQQSLIVNKVLTIYAPLAERLGVFYFKRRFEDQALKYQEPEIYRQIEDYHSQTKAEREQFVGDMVGQLQRLLDARQIKADIFGRAKHNYSVYKKFMTDRRKRRPDDTIRDYLARLHDKYAFTVLVDTLEECYRALDDVHQQWDYDPSELDDYIASPKPNGYRSLQTVVHTESGNDLEIQIRTHAMHEYNEYGPASHLFYKEIGREKGSRTLAPEKKIAMLRGLMRWQEHLHESQAAGDSDEMKIKSFRDRVFVFTPKGDVKDLPKGVTPIDFAYAVHTEVGESMMGAKVNDRIVALSCELQNSDVCEIMTTKQRKKPSYDWLRIAKTRFARSKIRQRLQEG